MKKIIVFVLLSLCAAANVHAHQSLLIGNQSSVSEKPQYCKINGRKVAVNYTVSISSETLLCIKKSSMWDPKLVNVKYLGLEDNISRRLMQ